MLAKQALAIRLVTARAVATQPAGGRLYATLKKKKSVGASAIVKKALSQQGSSASATAAKKPQELTYQQQAIKLAYERKFQESLNMFQLAIKENPSDPSVHLNLGTVALDAGLPDLALEALQKARELAPQELKIVFPLSRALQAKANSHPEMKAQLLEQAEKLLLDGLEKQNMWPEALIDLGTISAEKGKIKKALAYFETAIATIDEMQNAALQSWREKAKAAGTKRSKHAPKLSPELGQRLVYSKKAALVAMSQVLVASGEPIKGVKALKLAAQTDREDADVLARIGEVYANHLNKRKLAMSFYREALRLQPESANIHKLIGLLYCDPDWSGYDLELGRRSLETALRFKSTPDLFFHLGWINVQLGEVERGKDCLERTRKLDNDPTRVIQASSILGDMELIQEKPVHIKNAMGYFEDALRVASKYGGDAPNVRTSMAKCHFLLGENTKALDLLREVVEKHPKNVDALSLLAEILFSEGQDDDAIEVVRHALKEKPKDQQLNYWMGRYFFKSQSVKPEITLKYLTRALKNIPDPVPLDALEKLKAGTLQAPEGFQLPPPYAGEAHLMVGLLFEGNEQANEALEHYQRAAEYDPDSSLVHVRAGLMLEILERPKEAQESFRRACVLDPESVEANFMLGNSFAESQQFEQAIIYYQKAAANAPKRPAEANNDTMYRLYHNLATTHKQMFEISKEPIHDQQTREYMKLAARYGSASSL